MATPTTTFRLATRDRARLDRLADDLLCARVDVLRLGMAALSQNRPLLRQIRADRLARSFLSSLRTDYGDSAVLELTGDLGDPRWHLGGRPLDTRVVAVHLRQQGDMWTIDLVSPGTNVAIHRAYAWEDVEGVRHARVPLHELWVHTAHAVTGEPTTRQGPDGGTVAEIKEDDGSVRLVGIDSDGNSRPLDPGVDAPVADLIERDSPPSVGIGVRRESKDGPHLGRGMGGKWLLTGDVQDDRAAVIAALEQLIQRTQNGDLDGILDLTSNDEGPVARIED